ncbi:MAG: hypothetical protein KDK51_08440, partial [Deltaproteobacteria bacterium]|nr:hypothetical protein [Deltaproteobacteria bacterium]
RNLLARPQINKELKAMILAEMGFDYLYSKTKDFGEHFFSQSLELQRKNAYALEGLYQCFRQQKKYPQALNTLKKLLRFTPDKRDQFNVIYAEMVMLHLQEGDLVQAQKWYKKATQSGKSALLDLMYVQLCLAENKTADAVDKLTAMIMQYTQHSAFLIHKLEDLLFETNQYDQYFQILTRCHQQNQNHPYVNHALAKYYEKTSQHDKAKQFYVYASQQHPSNLQIFKDSVAFFHKHQDVNTLPTIENFLSSITANKTYACDSCQEKFDRIPKHCKTCKGWNLFDIQYTFND